MSLHNFIRQARLRLAHGLYETRKAMTPQDDWATRPLLVTALEERVLMSASPLAVVAEAPEAGADSSQLTDQQMLDVVADSVLPEPSASIETADSPANAHELEVVFIDSSISDLDQMIADLQSEDASDDNRTLEIVVLDSQQDGIAQITSALLNYRDIDAVHVISHGGDGQVRLGATNLSLDNVDTYRPAINAWQYSMSDTADLMFYGCDLAATEDGRDLMNQIADETNSDVAASDDLTGHESLGGDWDLEFQSGTIETQVVFSTDFQQIWNQTLNVVIDASSSGSTPDQASVTVSHTTSGENRLMLVSVSTDPHGESVSTVTYNGDSLSLVGIRDDGGHSRVEIWSLVAPDTGTHDVVVTMTGAGHSGVIVGAMTFTDVDQTTPLVNFSSAAGSSTSASTTVTSAADDLVFGVVHSHNSASATPGTGQTEYWDLTDDNSNGSGTTEAGAASVTTSWTVGNDDWTVAAVSIQAAPASPVITTSETVDMDADGQIDRIKVTMDENLDDDFSGLTMSVSGYTVTGYTTGAANDNIFYIDLTESGSVDTDATPTVLITANSSLSKSDGSVAVAATDWWNTSWQNRKRITFDNTASAEDLTDYPVLVNLTAADIDFDRIKADGADIRFVDDDGTLLDYEIDSWDDGAETASVWVKVQQVNLGSADDYIHLYYNNTAATDAQNAAAVWPAGTGVYHLNEDPGPGGAGDIKDSDASAHDGTAETSMTSGDLVTGRIGNAIDFDEVDDYINFASTDIGDTFTIEAWIKPDSSGTTIQTIAANHSSGSNTDGYRFFINSSGTTDGKIVLETGNGVSGDSAATATGVINFDQWNHVAVEVDRVSGTATIYHNGVDVTVDGTIRTDFDTFSDWEIGRMEGGQHFNGVIDEFRIASVAHTADWLEADYLSQNAASTFTTIGGQESVVAADAVGPIVVSRQTADLDNDGYIDAIHITLSETVQDSTINAGDWDVAGVTGEAFSSTTNGDTADDADFYITFADDVLDTGETPLSTYTQNATADAAGNLMASDDATSWWNSNWQNRKQITFDNTASAENLTDFPLLVRLTSADVDFAKIKADGADIRFIDHDGTALAYEIEEWDDTAETATIWVKVQQINLASSTDYIHVYYNNSAATDAQDPTNVWDSNYEAVWHLQDDFLDSTSNNVDATNNGSTDSSGLIGDGQGLDGTDDYIQSSLPSLLQDIGANDFTVEFTFNANDLTSGLAYTRLVEMGDDSDEFAQLIIDGDSGGGLLTFSVEDNGVQRSVRVDTAITAGTWYHAVGVWDASADNVDFYLNGVEQTTAGTTTVSEGTLQSVTIGRRTDGNADTYFDGLADEFRISDATRSADWIEAVYLSQSSGSTFNTFGNEQTADARESTDNAAAVLMSATTPQSTGSNLFQAEGQQLDLVFSESLGGSISEVNLEAALLFAAGATDGDNLPTIGAGSNPISLVTTSDTNDTIRITYNASNTANANWSLVGTHTVQVTTGTNITDAVGNTANTSATAVTITGDTNDAPALDNSGTMTLTTINEDNFTSAGDTVANIILSATGDRITDADTVPVEGMAVIGVDDTNGTWQYNTGSGWAAFGPVSNTSAVLLNPSATIRFVPDADYAGSSGDITFRAWDQTSGSNGDTAVNVSGNGGTTAFSTATETASLTVTNINDAPVAAADGGYPALLSGHNPLSYLRLGESAGAVATDLGSVGNDGTYIGGTLAQAGALPGDSNTAVHLNGSSEYLQIAHDAAYLIDSGTIQMWFNADTLGSAQTLFSKDASGYATGGHITLDLTASGQLSLRIQDSSSSYTATSAALVSTGTWYHTAVTFGSGGLKVYLDGTEVASHAYTGGLGASSGTPGNEEGLAIGASRLSTTSGTWDSVSQHFDGLVDEFAIIGSQLSQPDVAALHSARSDISYTATEDVTLNINAAQGVLANDVDVDDTPTAVLDSGPSNAASFTLNSDGSFDYTATANYYGTDSFTYHAYDGVLSSSTVTVTITISPANDAPVLDNTGDMELTDVYENNDDPVGDLVSDIISSAGGDRITDIDSGAVEGVVVTAVDDTKGTWQYSTDGGTSWNDFGSVSSNSAVVLTATANDRIRFVGDTNFNGFATITFNAWDAMDGNASGTSGVDASTTGDATSYSTASETATVIVISVDPKIWFSTAGPVSGGGTPNFDTWKHGEIVAVGDPNFSIEPGTSGGTFFPFLDLNNFNADGLVKIRSTHKVDADLTIGNTSTIDLKSGDILLSVNSSETFTGSDFNAININDEDVFVFRPDAEDDYSSGIFFVLFDDLGNTGDEVNSLTLVEQTTDVGDATLQAGTFMYTTKDAKADIYHFTPDEVGTTTTGTRSILIDGSDIGMGGNGGKSAGVSGLDLIESNVTVSGTLLQSGTLVVSLDKDDNSVGDGSSISVTPTDIFTVQVTTTGWSTAGTASMFFQGTDVNLNSGSEEIRSISLHVGTGATNVDPEIALPGAAVSYTEGDPATVIDATATVADPDSANFKNGVLLVDFSANGSVNDRLAIRNEGVGAGQVGVSGSDITYSGTVIGTFTGGTSGSTPLVVTFNSSSDVTSVQAVLRNVTYENVLGVADASTRTVRFVVSDGDGGVSNVVTEDINILSANDPPVASNDAYDVNEDTLLDTDNLWYDASWQYRRQLTFDNSAQTENLTDFPVLIKLNSSRIDYGQTQDAGEDIRFTDADGTLLSYEIESWEESGDSYVWVKVPVIDGSSGSDSIWMYYGNAGAADAQNATEVWTQSYNAVYHLVDDTGTVEDFSDSGGNDFHGTNAGSASSGGAIAGGQYFEGDDEYIDLGSDQAFLNNASAATLSVWVNPDTVSGNGDILGISRNDAGPTENSRAAIVRIGDNIAVYASTQDNFSDAVMVTTTTSPLTVGDWHHVTAAIDYANDTVKIFIDGVEQATSGTVSFSGTATANTNSTSAAIGADEDGTGDFFEGVIDEARISDVLRSDDWIAAQHLSMTDANFVSFGVQEDDAGVLRNDSDPDGDALTAILVSGPSNASSFTLNADGSFTYQAITNYNGADSFTYKVNDGTLDSSVATVNITVNPVNDAPTLTATADSPTFTEGGAAVGLYNSTSINTVDAGDLVETITLTVAGLQNGSDEILVVDGTSVALTDTNSVSTGANSYDVNVSVSSGTATVTITRSGNYTAALAQTLIDGLTYQNDSQDPQGASRTVTLTYIKDDGGTINGGDDDTVLSVVSTVTVSAVNDDPVINSSATASVAENQTATLTVTSTDVDGGTPSYSITGGADSAKFSINSSTGVMTFSTAPDFENPTDAGTNNVYDVQVTVSDGAGGTDVQAIAVTVTDVNDDPIITSSATASVAENQTAVLTVTTTDEDLPADTVTYSITGGADQARFSINSSTGVLTFSTAPDYENPTDVGTDNIYDVQVTVNDGSGGTDVQAIAVTVTDVNDDPIITSSATASVAENQTAVLTVTSTDEDLPADTVTYSITGGADQTKFSINSSTGVLTFNTAPDVENPTDVGTDNVYDVQVTANDNAGGTDVQAIAVTVTDVNDDPVITSSATASVAENQTAVLTVTSTDADLPADTVTYSITGGADQARFSINSSTGVLTFSTAPDYENPTDVGTDNIYDVQVTVNDGSGGTDVQAIAVTVTDVNDDPIITSSATASVAENQTAVLTVTSTDEDLPADTVTYSITGGADQTKFSINSSTGVLTFNTAPDAENPTDVGTNNIYDVQVTANDNAGGTDVQAIAVTVTDVNDDPVITSSATASVAENQTAVLTVTSTDADLPADTVTYSITGGADQARFSINSSTGVLTFSTAPDYENPTDVGTDNIYDVQVTANDGSGGTDVQAIAVTVTDVNDAPTITSVTDQNVLEDTATGPIAFTVGDDESAPGSLTVTATSNDQALIPDGNITLGGSGANRTINVLPGLNQNGGPVTITVTVNDGTTTTQTTFDVTVAVVNNAPTVLLPSGAVTFTEGDAATVIDSMAVVSDVDSPDFDTGTLTVDLTVGGTANDRLTINNQGMGAGQIGISGSDVAFEGTRIGTFSGGTDGTTPLVITFDASATPTAVEALVQNISYENVSEDPATAARTVRFVLTDGDGGTSTTETETINVTSVNDLSVVTTNAVTIKYTGGGAIDIDSTLTVTDVDDNILTSAEIRLTAGYVQGEDILLFTDQSGITGAFDNATGILTLTGSATIADYQTALRSVQYDNVNSSPTFGILAASFTVNDGTNISSAATRLIEIIDEDPPRASNDSATVSEGGSVLIDLAANDSDNFNALDLTSISIVSGPGNGSVLINGDGTVTYTHNASETTTDTFTYSISDGSGFVSNTATVSLTITPTNDAPTITSIADQTPLEDTATGDVAFKVGDPETAPGALTVTATSNDQTLVPDGNITLGGTGFNRTINILPGLNQTGGPATITVTVDDGTTTTQTTFDVTVTATNDAPTDIALSGAAVDENSADGTIVGTVSGTDVDAGDSVTFSLTDTAGGRFAVDLNTGRLTVAFGSLLNFEDASAHSITVRATDSGGLSRDESFIISVNDVNDAPTTTDDSFSVNQLEDLVVPAGVIITNDFDADGDSLSVVLVSGPTEGAFALAADGSFTYTSAGSFSGQDQFTYYVTDGTLNSAVATVNIDVTMTISGVGPTALVDAETPDSSVDAMPAEDSDTPAEDSSSKEASADKTVSGTAGSSAGQTGDSFAEGDTPDEIPQLIGSEMTISVMLVDVPEAGLLNRDPATQRDGAEKTVESVPPRLDRYPFQRVFTENPFVGSGIASSVNVNIHEPQDDQWGKDQIIEQVVVGSTAVVSTSVSVGYVMWLLRGGSLLTTFLSSLPAWQAFDPLAVLESFDENGDQGTDDESLESLVSGS